jgi:hypothetical protein
MRPAGDSSEPSPAPDRERPDVDAILCADDDRVDRALAIAVREALLVHKKLGHAIHVWQDGRVVEIPPDEIPV